MIVESCIKTDLAVQKRRLGLHWRWCNKSNLKVSKDVLGTGDPEGPGELFPYFRGFLGG